jgi:hypothetical protein
MAKLEDLTPEQFKQAVCDVIRLATRSVQTMEDADQIDVVLSFFEQVYFGKVNDA